MPETQTPSFNVFKTVFVYSALIIFAPITSFFAVKYCLLEGLFGLSNLSSNVWSAVVAVIILHLALGMFIYKAYFESGKGKPDEKVD